MKKHKRRNSNVENERGKYENIIFDIREV